MLNPFKEVPIWKAALNSINSCCTVIRIEDVKSELLLLNEKMNPLQVRFNLLLNRSSDEVIELDSLNNFAGKTCFDYGGLVSFSS